MHFNQTHFYLPAQARLFFFTFLLTLAQLFSTATCYGNDLIFSLEGHTGTITSVAYSPDGQTLASGAEDNTIKLWDVSAGHNIATFEGHRGPVTSVAYSPDGKTLASGSWDGTTKLWDVSTGQAIATLQGHTDWVTSVAYSPDGVTLISGSDDDTIRLWDISVGRIRILATLKEHRSNVTSVAYSPDGQTLVSGSKDGTIKLWDVSTGGNITTLYGNRSDEITSVAYSPDGKTLASGTCFIYPGQSKGQGTIKLWDVGTGQAITTLKGHAGFVTSVAYSPDSKTLASGGRDYAIKLWNVSSRRSGATEEE